MIYFVLCYHLVFSNTELDKNWFKEYLTKISYLSRQVKCLELQNHVYQPDLEISLSTLCNNSTSQGFTKVDDEIPPKYEFLGSNHFEFQENSIISLLSRGLWKRPPSKYNTNLPLNWITMELVSFPYMLLASQRYSPRSLKVISDITQVSLSCLLPVVTWVHMTEGVGVPEVLQNKVTLPPFWTGLLSAEATATAGTNKKWKEKDLVSLPSERTQELLSSYSPPRPLFFFSLRPKYKHYVLRSLFTKWPATTLHQVTCRCSISNLSGRCIKFIWLLTTFLYTELRCLEDELL